MHKWHVVYPKSAGFLQFQEMEKELTMETEVKAAATPHAGSTFAWAYYGATLGGYGAFVVLGFVLVLLTNRHKAKAAAVRVGLTPVAELAV